MPGPWPTRDAQRVATRARLIACAGDIVRAEGHAALTVDRVATAASVNRTTFYLHFTGRNELSLAIGVGYLQVLGEAFGRWESTRRPSAAAARRWVGSLVDDVAADVRIAELLDNALLTTPESAALLNQAMDSALGRMPRTLERLGESGRQRLHVLGWSLLRTGILLESQRGLLPREAALDLLAQQWFRETAAHSV